MWWAGSEQVDVFLGRTRVGLQRPGKPARWEQGVSADDLWNVARDAIRADGRASVRVWLGGALARPFILPVMEGLAGIRDARAIAATRAAEETGLAGPCSVSIDAWQPDVPTVCVAIEEDLHHRIEHTGSKEVRVIGIRPWWSAVLCDAGTDAGSLAVLTVDDGESLVTLAGAGDAITVASSYTPAPEGGQRTAMVQRILSGVSAGAGAQRHARLAPLQEVPPVPSHSRCPFAPLWDGTP